MNDGGDIKEAKMRRETDSGNEEDDGRLADHKV